VVEEVVDYVATAITFPFGLIIQFIQWLFGGAQGAFVYKPVTKHRESLWRCDRTANVYHFIDNCGFQSYSSTFDDNCYHVYTLPLTSEQRQWKWFNWVNTPIPTMVNKLDIIDPELSDPDPFASDPLPKTPTPPILRDYTSLGRPVYWDPDPAETGFPEDPNELFYDPPTLVRVRVDLINRTHVYRIDYDISNVPFFDEKMGRFPWVWPHFVEWFYHLQWSPTGMGTSIAKSYLFSLRIGDIGTLVEEYGKLPTFVGVRELSSIQWTSDKRDMGVSGAPFSKYKLLTSTFEITLKTY
jgi:hypothetical protein